MSAASGVLMTARERVDAIVKAYDVRGRSPQTFDPSLAFVLGAAFAEETQISGRRGCAVVGRDMRESSPAIAAAIIDGITAVGGDVVDLGLASTDLLYFASGTWELPGVMVTASHNPAGYNGLKFCRAGARPVGRDSGLAAIADGAVRMLDDPGDPGDAQDERGDERGTVTERSALEDYAARLVELVPLASGVRTRPLRVVVDAANAMAGHVVPSVFAHLDVELVPLYFELDGRFPNHDANPLEPANLVDLQAAVTAHRADLGLAFDGDADRCFVVDEGGALVTPSAITSLIALRYLAKQPGATILHNVICSRAVPEIIAEAGGVPIRTPVGHSLIKAEMARTGAVFGGEHSGHFYFADFFLADTGMLAALHVLAALAETTSPLSALMSRYERYVASGEINRSVDDADAVMSAVEHATGRADGVVVDHMDGLTVSHPDWWFNLRSSQTEPLLHLNVEAQDDGAMHDIRDEVLAMIDRLSRGDAPTPPAPTTLTAPTGRPLDES